MNKTYSEKLRDPRWQKLRLKVLERDDWTCQSCHDTTSPLNVHHKEYGTGKEPWDYAIDNFVTLCDACHARERNERYGLEKRLIVELRRAGVLTGDLEGLAAKLLARNSRDFQEALARFLDTFCLVFHVDWEMTQSCLARDSDKLLIAEGGTFLTPKVEDESNNWGNRGSLLAAYRELLTVMKKMEMPVQPFFDDALTSNNLELDEFLQGDTY